MKTGERQGMEMIKNNGPTPVQLKTKSMITHFRNTKSIEYNINPSMYLKKKVVSETGSGVGAPKQGTRFPLIFYYCFPLISPFLSIQLDPKFVLHNRC